MREEILFILSELKGNSRASLSPEKIERLLDPHTTLRLRIHARPYSLYIADGQKTIHLFSTTREELVPLMQRLKSAKQEYNTYIMFQTLYGLLYRKHPEQFKKLKEKFPEMVKTAMETEIIPWEDEYAIGDKNPEVIEELRFWEELYRNGMVDEKECRRRIDETLRKAGYASRTEGIAFIEEKKVSFRSKVPPFWVVLHELGHVHYQIPDSIWNATYGGAEILVHLSLEDRYDIREENVRQFIWLKKLSYKDPKEFERIVIERLRKVFPDTQPSILSFMLLAGTIPPTREDLHILDHRDPKLTQIETTPEVVQSFMVNLVEGLRWGDPFYRRYAEVLGMVEV